MNLPLIIRIPLLWLLYFGIARRRRADQFIGVGPYMLRWWIFGTSSEPDERGEPKPRELFGRRFYFHCFLRSDEDRALHDHPWTYTTCILFGRYEEHSQDAGNGDWRGANHIRVFDGGKGFCRGYMAGNIAVSKEPGRPHRLALYPQEHQNGPGMWLFGIAPSLQTQLPWMSADQVAAAYRMWRKEIPCWTLFITGKWERDWGYHCADGWKYWRDFDRDGGCQ